MWRNSKHSYCKPIKKSKQASRGLATSRRVSFIGRPSSGRKEEGEKENSTTDARGVFVAENDGLKTTIGIAGWRNDWLTELAGSPTGFELVFARTLDHLAGEAWLTNLLLQGNQIPLATLCFSSPSRDSRGILSQHGPCLVFAPHIATKPLWWKERSVIKKGRSCRTREFFFFFYTPHMCTNHYRSPRGFTQARCVIPSRVWDQPVPSSALLITGMFRAFYLTQTRPRASGPSRSFTTWNSSHIIRIKKKKKNDLKRHGMRWGV